MFAYIVQKQTPLKGDIHRKASQKDNDKNGETQ